MSETINLTGVVSTAPIELTAFSEPTQIILTGTVAATGPQGPAGKDGIDGTGSGGAAVWGTVTGTITDQSDLQAELGTKLTASSNLSDIPSPATARSNLGLAIGTSVEAFITPGLSSQYLRGDKTFQDFNTAVRANRLNDMAAPSTSLNIGSQRLINAADPVSTQDLATKAYVDAVSQGLSVKSSVVAATTAALPTNTYASGVLTATANGALTVDGVTVSTADRVLVKDESTAANNGIYTVTATGDGSNPYVLTRVSDMDSAAEIKGAFSLVIAGTVNANTGWVVSSPGPFTLGTTSIPWSQFSTSNFPDATASVKGKLQLAGDLGGTASLPTVPGLAAKVPTSRLINTTAPLTGGGDLSADRTLAVLDATTSSKGVIELAGDLGGTASSPTVKRTVTRTVATQSSGYVADYYTDGTADDVEIQTACDDVYALGGGVVLVRGGTYNIAGTISLRSNTVLSGEGPNTYLFLVNGANVPAISNVTPTGGDNYIEVKNLTVDGNYLNQTTQTGLITFRNVNYSSVRNCDVINAVWDHITFGQGSPPYNPVGSCYNSVKGNRITGGNGHGVLIANNSCHNIVKDNLIHDIGAANGHIFVTSPVFCYGVYVYRGSSYNIVADNEIVATNGHGISININPGDTVFSSHNQIVGNNIADAGTINTTISDHHGIFVVSPENLISNNKITRTRVYGIFVQNYGYNQITGNNVSLALQHGIRIENSDYNTISDNRSYNNGQSSAGVYDGFSLGNAAGIETTRYNQFIGNYAFDNQLSPTQNWGIHETNSTAAPNQESNFNTFSGNYCKNNIAGQIITPGVDNLVYGNYDYDSHSNGFVVSQLGLSRGLTVNVTNASNNQYALYVSSTGARGIHVDTAADGGFAALSVTKAGTGSGTGLDLNNAGTGTGLNITQSGSANGIQLSHTGNTGSGFALTRTANSGSSVIGLNINTTNSGGGAAYGLIVQAGRTGLGTTSPTSLLHLAPGTASANTAPLKFTAGTNLTTPENGAVEYDGTHFYATVGSTRYQLDQQSTGSGITRSVTTITTTTTIGATALTDYVVFIDSGGAPTLPTAVSNTNRYTLKNIHTTNKTVSTTSSQTIDGSTAITLTPNTSVDVVSDGANWRII